MLRATRRFFLLLGPCLAAFFALAALGSCGARTGLDLPFRHDAGPRDHRDATMTQIHDATVLKDTSMDVPIPNDGRMLDVNDECATPTYCVPSDPNYIYKCGERIFQCGSLQQCEEQCPDAGSNDAGEDAGPCVASCVDPCLNALGQNTSSGCEFYPVEMDTTPNASGVCYAVFIVNQWTTGEPAKLEVDLGGEVLDVGSFARIPSGTGRNITYAPFDPNVGIPQNEVAILFLSRQPASQIDQAAYQPAILANCPEGVVPAVVGDSALHGTGIGTAFHIRSNVPVVAYQMLPYGGGAARVTGATLLLPTNVWGTNYLAANAYELPGDYIVIDGGADATAAYDPQVARAGPSMVVIAQNEDTHVTINPVVSINQGPGVAHTPAGVPITYTIGQGQYLQFTQLLELSGSAIQSDKPVAVISGSTLMDIPINTARADHGEQMIPPVQALGSQYVGVRYRTRTPPVEEVVPWRIIGAVDGTELTFDPPQNTSKCPPVVVHASGQSELVPCGAPTTLKAHEVVEFDATGPFVVYSQDDSHPFYFAQYMTGGFGEGSGPGGIGGGGSGEGDPEYVNVVAPEQYLPRYTFFTDPTYPETNLVMVRALDRASGQFPDVTLDCSGLVGGWQPVGSGGEFQFTRLDLSTGDFQGQNGCNNGVHTITGAFTSDAGASAPLFGVTIWGWGSFATYPVNEGDAGFVQDAEVNPNYSKWVSYAYPAGANILKLNNVLLSAQ